LSDEARGAHSDARPKHDEGGEIDMSFSGYTLQPIVALIAGILILFMPKILNYIVAFYLILIGIMGLVH
jgi:hypothetical protein